MINVTLRRQLRYGTRVVYAETTFTDLGNGITRVESFDTDRDGRDRMATEAPRDMSHAEANSLKCALLSAREVVGRTRWTEAK